MVSGHQCEGAIVADPSVNQPDAIDFTQQQITFANRAPNSKDKGLFWVKDTGTDAVLYVRSKTSGTWVAQK